MRSRIANITACLGLLLLCGSVRALEVPVLSGRVNDYANILDPEFAQSLENELRLHEEQTSNQVVVLIIPSLEGDDLEEFAFRTFNQWKLGQKDKDNGVLLLVAAQDRKLRIEVGYGLEGALTDVKSGRIIRNVIVPFFKAGEFADGVGAGASAIIKAISTEYAAEGQDQQQTAPTRQDRQVQPRPQPQPRAEDSRHRSGGEHERYQSQKTGLSNFAVFVFITLLIFVLMGLHYLQKHVFGRYRKRYGKSGEELEMLSEVEDDVYLSPGQNREEDIGSIEYDVWVSPDRKEVQVIPYKKRFKNFFKCPKCGYRTKYLHEVKKESVTLSGYDLRKRFRCHNCSHMDDKVHHVVIPKTPPPRPRSRSTSYNSGGSLFGGFSGGGGSSRRSSRRRSSSSSSWGGSSSSSRRSSSSGGFSSGGGSSGGGGASGGW